MNILTPDQQRDPIVRIFRTNGEYAGNGFFVDAEGGILTTLYVAREEKEFIVIAPNNQRFAAVLERVDGISELALISTSGRRQQSFLSIRNVKELTSGEKVKIVGYAGNTLSALEATAAGTYAYDTLSPEKILLRVDTPPRGLSGAPAIDKAGDVVGIMIAYLPERMSALMVAGATALAFIHTREAS